jgi:hypothetical protein
MYKVSWKEEGSEKNKDFDSLDSAMEHAKNLNLVVEIKGINSEFTMIGKFGVDCIQDGVCPDGVEYSWRKRRP